MDADRWRQISRLYHEAHARPDDERRAFLNAACQGDEALRDEVAALLADDARAESFLAAPVAAAFADLGQPDDPFVSSAIAPGTILGGYRVERLLGRGGMGAVFLAHDTRLHRQVALKILDTADDADGSGASDTRLLREARNAAALNHPHICTIYEVGDAGGTAFIAMEYVEGASLRERREAGALPVDEAARLGIQAADALAHAHARGVVHRDFKAANAIVTADGRLKVVDFGLARRGDALLAGATTEMSLAPAGSAAGTPYAMAPEQVRGEKADARTDVWALGVLLYELVSGRKPFEAPTVPQLFSAILRDAPAALPSGVPLALDGVIERCLEKDPAARYQQAGDVRAALEGIAAGTASPWTAVRYQLRRRPLTSAAAVVVAILAVLIGGNLAGVRDRLVGTPPVPPPIRLAVLPFENLTGDPEQEYLSDGLTEEMTSQLGRLHPARLSVIARTSAMRYKGRTAPLDQIGRELEVDYVLEGSARRDGSRIRVSATLVHVVDQTQRWTDSFDRELSAILTLQSDVARGVARSLALALLPEEEARLTGARPVNPDAYEAYLRAMAHLELGAPSNIDGALRYFELALEKDPTYAPAHVGIGLVWGARQQYGLSHSSEAAPKLRAARARALELDDTLAEVHYALASQAAWTDWDWSAAGARFRRAIELNPNYARAHAFYSHYLHIMQRPDEAMPHVERALDLDPFNPEIQAIAAVAFLMAQRFDAALAHARRALELAPGRPVAVSAVVGALHHAGRYEEAVAAERELLAAGRGDLELDAALAQGYDEAGYGGAMLRAADTLAARSLTTGVAPQRVARMYLYGGDRERALDWLERAFDNRDPNLPYISSGLKHFDAVRDHPRFQALLQRMNLPPYSTP